jgi:hypothetical protein
LQEYEVVQAPGGGHALALTLQRAIGWLSRRDLSTRGVGAGPDLATPEAQVTPAFETPWRFALGPAQDAALDETQRATQGAAEWLQSTLQWRQPLLSLPGHAPGAWRAPLNLPPGGWVPSCVRPLPGGGLELRAWNPSPHPLPADLPGWTRVDGSGAPLPQGPVAAHGIASWRKTP